VRNGYGAATSLIGSAWIDEQLLALDHAREVRDVSAKRFRPIGFGESLFLP
jgi:hypothetical protein